LVDQKRLEEAFRLLDAGKESLRSLEAKLGVSKSTLQRWYISWLDNRVEERKKALKEVEDKISRLTLEFNRLESVFDEKNRILEEAYRKKKANLEEEIAKLRRETITIKAAFERQGMSWDEGIKIVANTASLKKERELLKNEVSKLERETLGYRNTLKQLKFNIQRLKEDELKLQKAVFTLKAAYHSYVNWFKTEAPKLERYKSQLQESIKTLESDTSKLQEEKHRLVEEVAKLQKEKTNSEASLKTIKAEKTKLEGEIETLSREVKGLAQRIVEDAEKRRAGILNEIEHLERHMEKLKAERDFLECTIRNSLKQLQQSRDSQKTDALSQAHKGN